MEISDIKDIWKRSQIKEKNLDNPITREEIMTQYRTLLDAYKETCKFLGQDSSYDRDIVFYGLMLGQIRRDPCKDSTPEELKERNELYQKMEHMIGYHAYRLVEDSKTLPLQAQNKISKRINRTAVAFMQNLHSYLFWGESKQFDGNSTAVDGLREMYLAKEMYESDIRFRAARKQRHLMDQMQEAAKLGVSMVEEINRLKEKNASPEEIKSASESFGKKAKEIGIEF